MSLTCAICEDQVMFRRMLSGLLAKHCRACVVHEFGTLAELRAASSSLVGLDLLLLDIRLPDGNGLDFIPEMARLKIQTPVLLLSSSAEEFIVHRVVKSMVSGYVHKDDEPKVLITAVQTVAAGGSFLSPRFVKLRRELAQSPTAFAKILSDREQELLTAFGAGFSDTDIAAQFALSPTTVKTHRYNIMEKLDLHSAQELQAYALRRGFTTIPALQK